MKKALALFLVLLTCGFCGMGAATAYLSDRQDQVEVTPVAEQGDSAVAQGLELVVNSYFQSMKWSTTYRPGQQPAAHTLSHFKRYWSNAARLDDLYPGRVSEGLIVAISHAYNTYDEDESSAGLPQAYRELAEEVGDLEEKSRVIRYKDYEPFYNIHCSVAWWDSDTDLPSEKMSTAQWNELTAVKEAQNETVEQFFRIPVLEEETHLITLSKQSNGTVSNYGHGLTDSDYFQFYVHSDEVAVTDQAAYFTFSNRTHHGNLVDTSHIPGGYGIYCLPYTRDYDPMTETGILVDQLAMVYPVDPQDEILSLDISLDQSKLILRTLEEDLLVVTIIDVPSMTTLQRLEICRVEQKEDLDIRLDQEQDIFLLWTGEEYRFFVMQEDGTYKQELTFEGAYIGYAADMAWDGSRLALGSVTRTDAMTPDDDNFFILWVYGSGGVYYQGRFDISLISKIRDESVQQVRETAINPIRLTWT